MQAGGHTGRQAKRQRYVNADKQTDRYVSSHAGRQQAGKHTYTDIGKHIEKKSYRQAAI